MIPAKPSHIKALAHLLDTGKFGSSTEAAKAMTVLYSELRSHDHTWVVLVQYAGILSAYGPFATQKQAVKAHLSGHAGVTGGRVAFCPMVDVTEWARMLAANDELPPTRGRK